MYILYDIGLVLSLLMGGVIGLMLARSRHRRYKAEVGRYLEVYATLALNRPAATAAAAPDRQTPP